jgi:ribosomal protein L3 glutamine methyltransferase
MTISNSPSSDTGLDQCNDNPSCTVGEILAIGESLFSDNEVYCGHGTNCAWDEAVCLLSFVVGLPPNADKSVLDKKLSESQIIEVKTLFQKRVNERLPAPYLTGQAWFCGLPFMVDSRVLIPRSPIAQLIMSYFEPWLSVEPSRILDLCTGGGCIGISCAYGFQEAEIILSDISVDALDVADINIENHELGKRVSTIQSDLFSGLSGHSFDLIVSNPPYVDTDDLSQMPEEFHHEPTLALTSGVDGLDFTRRLLKEASGYLMEKGLLIVEVGNSSVALEEAFPLVPFLWFEFEEGDGGVFMLTREQLIEHRDLLS